jgi:glycosyltransferase 2 family protein
MRKPSVSNIAKFALKIALSAMMIYWLLSGIDRDTLFSHVRNVSMGNLFLLLLLYIFLSLVQSQRWRLVLGRQGISLSIRLAISITMLGNFFNQILPSTVGSDIVRVWGVHRTGASLSASANAAIVDRLIALLALVIMGACGLPALIGIDADGVATWSVIAMSLISIFSYSVFLVIRITPLRRVNWLPVRSIVSLSNGLWSLLTNKKATAGTLGLSFIIHFGIIAITYMIGLSMGVTASLAGFLAVMPPVILISSLPISIAGWGVREGAAVVGLGLLGIPFEKAVAISVVLGGIMAVAGLFGGGYWLVDRFFSKR